MTFLNGAQTGGDWQSTQTVPVTGLAAGAATSSSVALTWTPIAYTGDTGGYQIFVATVSGGPYTPSGSASGKTSAGWSVTGLSPGTPYYFITKSVTNPHARNQNTVVSDPSAEVFRSTLAGLAIPTTSALPEAAVGAAYSRTFTATGGVGPYSWRVISGSLPPGLLLSSGGVLGGNPTTEGSSSFTVQVMDAAENTSSAVFTLQVRGTQVAAIPALDPLGLLCLIAALGVAGALLARRLAA